MRVVVLAGGVGGSKFVRGVCAAFPSAEVTIIGNTADDLTLHGLRICPDLDTMMYSLGDGISTSRGWGRDGETFVILDELKAYGVEPTWFGLGDKDLATHLVRTQLWNAGASLTDITAALSRRWLPDHLRLLPMTDDRVETHIVVADPDSPSGQRTIHFQDYWVRLRAEVEALATIHVGISDATPAPGTTEALAAADLILVAPSNPVVSIGPIVSVPGMRAALLAASAPVIGFSGIINNRPVLGMADKLLPSINVACTAAAVGRHYGSRAQGGLLDQWVVHHDDHDQLAELADLPLFTRSDDLIMSSPQASARFIRAAVDQQETRS